MSWQVMLTDWEITESDIDAVMETLRSGWLTMGPRTQDLEAAMAERTGAEHAVATSSASAALHLACVAAGVGEGDEVVVPAMSFVADAHAPRLAGAETVLCDIESLERPHLGVAEVEAAISDRTKAVILVHMFGYAADVAGISSLCAERGIALIEDCAQAPGALLDDGRSVGSGGICGIFSLYAKTSLGAGEGGVMISSDEGFITRVRSLRSHAMTSVTWDRHRGHAETYDVTDLGFNYRLDETRATLALSRFARLDESLAEQRRIAGRYRELLSATDGFSMPFAGHEVDCGAQSSFPILVSDRSLRDQVREHLRDRDIQSTSYPALPQLTEYADHQSCPLAEEFADRHIALPIYAGISDAQFEMVVAELNAAIDPA